MIYDVNYIIDALDLLDRGFYITILHNILHSGNIYFLNCLKSSYHDILVDMAIIVRRWVQYLLHVTCNCYLIVFEASTEKVVAVFLS